MTRQSTRAGRARSGKRLPGWLLPTVVGVLAIALIAVSFTLNRGETDSAQPEDHSPAEPGPTEVQQPESDLTVFETRSETDLFAVGALDADVAMIVFSDFQCPYCARWHQDTLPAMMQYVDEGKLRIEFRDVAIFGDESEYAVQAIFAAAQQDALLEYQHALFPNGATRQEADLSLEALIALAAELGLDEQRFASDLESEEARDVVDEHGAFAASLGVYSTPAFIIGGEPVLGAQPTDVFVNAVEQALQAA